ncbi:type I 3-dehydroquinate dehydratase [Candidatus Roizmanbacteria bacterium RIFCSPLOWO2_01_FULL_38_12]|uniref:3-dehydroquinate dehydratase n=1 Tax=Candidatus Roizmanbacteria bacterium RIFCSPLOWO2_01_FULL_38_12 TaxID=1802061 RepID=A0A1F7IR29_9BACT|nr:MAG: type I 3-dehydroquinate dehydratase [Candidatus Roizmanbacteria bacterium RIFCSPHIGHO2_12_FULL_38_13]OGK45808.1 MAG: type I 3-dehydroquinate dehydratase [Candidatus Roizmanbacteria bacterium RIFCSPLOWO2_01_FULL_38_12]
MNIRICTPVIGTTLDDFLSNLKKTEEISDFVELRVDYIQDFTETNVEVIRKETNVQSIFTCRKKEEGGKFNGDENNRVGILQKAIELGFDHVDIELSTIKEYQFKRDNTKLIISYHNFVETPSYWDMQSIIYEMNEFKPDILKIATVLTEEYETTKIYRLLTNKPHNEERIVIGMGEKGRVTRILVPLLGSYLTYASTEFGESAPGQIGIEELKNIYNTILSFRT